MEKTIGELAKKQGVFYDLKDEIIAQEFENTMDGDWALVDTDVTSEIFNSLTQGERKVYALLHSQSYAEDLLAESPEEFERNYGGMYNALDLIKF